jgi:hypothetical protein
LRNLEEYEWLLKEEQKRAGNLDKKHFNIQLMRASALQERVEYNREENIQ